jgi:site-specific DNA-methyltransferase (adenine-specific)
MIKIIEKEVNSLIPYEFNNKIHDEIQINKIANSIKEFWFLQPIVIDKNNIVVVWHWRLEWAKKLWLEKIPCILAEELNEEQIKKYRILDNRLNESDYDLWNLKLELDWLEDFNFGDLEYWVLDLFPEFETPEFNPNEIGEDEEKDDEWKVCVKVYVEDQATAELLKKDLAELWYTNFK